MTSLVPYASSDEEDEKGGDNKSHGRLDAKRKRLTPFDGRSADAKEAANKSTKVHTSLGISASRPIKGDWLCYAFIPSELVREVSDSYRSCIIV
jgi:hypothetical protein